MTFLAAGWLTLLAPFAAIVWLALRRAPVDSTSTTAAFLWRDRDVVDASVHARRRRPPLWTVLALAALATAILALARPARRVRQASVVVVADPAARLALGGEASPLTAMFARVRAVADDATLELLVPGQPDDREIGDVRPTARSTAPAIAATLARLRREGRDVVVLTDAAAFQPTADRAIVRPVALRPDVAIGRLAARDVGVGVQTFVTVTRSDRSIGSATLRVTSGDARAERLLRWQGDALSADVVVALDSAGEAVEASLVANDDADPTNDRAWLLREADVRVAVAGGAPEAASRFAAAMRAVRPPRGEATLVTIGDRVDAAAPSVIVASGAAVESNEPLRRVEHPLLAGLNAEAFDGAIAGEPPAGFEAIAWRGDRAIAAVRDGPPRAAWVGLDATRPTPAWVALMDAAVMWAAGGSRDAWTGVASDELPAAWTADRVDDARVEASPGVYRDEAGRSRAVNAVAPTARAAADGDASLAAFFASARRRGDASLAGPLAGPVAGLAAALALSAAIASSRRAGFSRGRARATGFLDVARGGT